MGHDVWPAGAPQVGQRAELARDVTARDIELFTAISGDRNPLRTDKPLTELRTTVTRGDGTVVLAGTATCYTMPLPRPAAP
jgi:acyl dehydratase